MGAGMFRHHARKRAAKARDAAAAVSKIGDAVVSVVVDTPVAPASGSNNEAKRAVRR